MPAKVRIKILQARNLPIMSKTHESTDAFVEVKIGQDAYKTDVCWRSLDPEWTNDWFRFELSDQAFFEEPVQIRVMDHDTYTSHDAIGKVQMRLSQFLNVRISEIKGQHHIKQWFPIYDTLHGQRGALLLELVVLPFGELAFPPVLCCSNYPYNIPVRRIYGLVDCAVLTDDPEYQWMDRIRASRTTNETRQLLFSKMSGALRRRIALKARRAGANAIIGYRESLDICCDAGVVMRAVGTAVRVDLPSRPIVQPADASTENSKTKTDAASSAPLSALLSGQPQQSYSFFVDDEAFISAVDGKNSAASDGKTNAGDDEIEAGASWLTNSCEFPFITTTSLPDRLVVRVGGLVSTRIVKKLGELDDINTHGVDYRLLPDSWLCDVRQEIRHHMLAADCNAVYGYQELVYPVPEEDIVIISAKATAVELICDLASVSSQGRTSADLLLYQTHANPSGAQAASTHYNGSHMPNVVQPGSKQFASRKTELSADEGTLLLSATSASSTAGGTSYGRTKSFTATDANFSCQYATANKRHDLFMRVVYDTSTSSTSSVDEPRVIVPSVVVSNTEPLACVDFVGRGSLIQVRVIKSFRKGVSDRIAAGGTGALGTPNVAGHHHLHHAHHHLGAASAIAGAVGLSGAVSNAKRTYRAWHARRRGFGAAAGGSSEHSSVAVGAVAGHSPNTAVLTRERRSEMDVATTNISEKRRLTELLSFIEFELYSQLIGKHRVVAVASGTAAYVLGLPGRPALPLVSSMSEGIEHAPDIEQQLMQFRQHAWKALGIRQAPAASADKSNRQRSTSENETGNSAQHPETPRHFAAVNNTEHNSPAAANRRLKGQAAVNSRTGRNAKVNNAATTDDYSTGDYYFDNMDQASINSAAGTGEYIVPLLPKGGAYRSKINRTASPVLRIELDSLSDTRRLVDLLDRFVSPSIVLTTSETMPHQHQSHNQQHQNSTRGPPETGNTTLTSASNGEASTTAGVVHAGRPLRSSKLSAASATGLNTLCAAVNTGSGLPVEHHQAGAINVGPATSGCWLLPGEAFVRIVLCRVASLDETLSDLMRYFRVLAGPSFASRNGKLVDRFNSQQQHKRINSLSAFPANINRRFSDHNVIDEAAGEGIEADGLITSAGNTTATFPMPMPLTPSLMPPIPIKVLGLELSLDTIEEADDDDLMLLTIQGTIFRPPTALDRLLSALRSQQAHLQSQHGGGGSSSGQPHHHHQHSALAVSGTGSGVNGAGGAASMSRRTGGRTSMQAAARSQSRELNALFLHKHTTNAASNVVPLHPSQLLKSSTDAATSIPAPPSAQAGNNNNVSVSTTGSVRAVGGLAMLHQKSMSAASSTTNSPLRYLSQPAGGSAAAVGVASQLPLAYNVGVQRFARTSLEQHVMANSALPASLSGTKQPSGASGSAGAGFRAFHDMEPPVYMTTLSHVPAPTKIVAYIGLINYYVIREEISLRESGSLMVEKTSQFLHGSLLQFAAMLRTLARAMGGNALLSLSVRQVQLMGRSQVLCHLTGDVVQIE